MQPTTFGRWIKKLRAEQDLTQEELSERVGCATPTLAAFETRLRRPSREMAERIADVLQVPARGIYTSGPSTDKSSQRR